MCVKLEELLLKTRQESSRNILCQITSEHIVLNNEEFKMTGNTVCLNKSTVEYPKILQVFLI